MELKILCKSINSIPLFMNGMFMVDLRIDIKTKEMLNITPSQKSYIIKCVSSIVKVISC